MTHTDFGFAAVRDHAGTVVDLTALRNGRPTPLLGPAGAAREEAVLRVPEADQLNGRNLPVLLGAGMGHALTLLLQRTTGPLAVVEAFCETLELSGLRERFQDGRIFWVTAGKPQDILSPEAVLTRLTQWQEAQGGKPFLPFVNPWYVRLLPDWHNNVRAHLTASARYNFWEKAATPRFQTSEPRLLLITSKYFLCGEVVGACEQLGYAAHLLTLEDSEVGGEDFVRRLLEAVLEFRPDFALTMNHLGIDREGVLAGLLLRLRLPLASWFVDNPHLILHLYKGLANPWVTLFTWDADNIDGLKNLGYAHVHHLPLGTDPQRFRPNLGSPDARLRAAVSFVGNSMVFKVGGRLNKCALPAALLRGYKTTAAAFGASTERSARQFVLSCPHLATAYEALPSLEDQLAFETLLTWEATRQYRAQCVQQLLHFNPLIVGDRGWELLFRNKPEAWRLHPEVSYYNDLPRFYPASTINFNCTSKQMKGAVNQRLFDVPAAGGFVLTDLREQMSELFEPGQEVICYNDPQEVPDLVRHYLSHPKERTAIVQAARKRVLAEHTWAHRVERMVSIMKHIYK